MDCAGVVPGWGKLSPLYERFIDYRYAGFHDGGGRIAPGFGPFWS